MEIYKKPYLYRAPDEVCLPNYPLKIHGHAVAILVKQHAASFSFCAVFGSSLNEPERVITRHAWLWFSWEKQRVTQTANDVDILIVDSAELPTTQHDHDLPVLVPRPGCGYGLYWAREVRERALHLLITSTSILQLALAKQDADARRIMGTSKFLYGDKDEYRRLRACLHHETS